MTDKARLEQIVGECIVKAAQIVLVSRVNAPTKPVAPDQRKCWFNLQIEELPVTQSELEHWKRHVTTPLVLEIYLQPGQPGRLTAAFTRPSSPSDANASEQARGMLLERWTLQYLHSAPEDRAGTARARLDTPAVYKRMVIMLRSLYSYVRMLPAFRMSRTSKRNPGASFSLQYTIARSPPSAAAAGKALSSMQRFAFTPLDTPWGTLSMGVQYSASAALSLLEQMSAPVAHPQVITDYVGGQQASGRPRSSLSTCLQRATTSQLPDPSSSPPVTTGILRTVSTPVAPLVRRSSWSLQNSALQESGTPYGTPPTPESAPQQPSQPHRPSPATGGGQLSRQVAAHQQQLQAGQGQVPFAPGTPVSTGHLRDGVQRISGTPPKHPTSLMARMSSGTAPAPSRPVQSSATSGAGSSGAPDPEAEQGTSTGAASVQRRTSAPVCIPGSSRACASSGDLWSLGQDPRPGHRARRESSARAKGPSKLSSGESAGASSAPATSHTMALPAGAAEGQAGAGLADARGDAQQADKRLAGASGGDSMAAPPTPTAPQHHPLHLASEDISEASSYPASCSPLLPFALTPTGQSLDPQAQHSLPRHGPSPPMSGRAGGALSLVRRMPSWSLRSSVLADQPPPTLMGYSVSPVAHDSLDSSMWSGSTPKHAGAAGAGSGRQRSGLPSPAPSPPTGRGFTRQISGSSASGQGSYRQGQPSTPTGAETSDRMHSLTSEDAEADALPFALDAEGSTTPSGSVGLGAAGPRGVEGSWRKPGADACGSLSGRKDEEVGAFVRLIQEARPLDSSMLAANSLAVPADDAFGADSSLSPADGACKVFNRLRLRHKLADTEI
ncbi:hypothetical protein WJX73_005890 [Symbiochloris irregularis]|uniref:Autophagy-related protein 13 N-terminal domain-containing protein n=1 Tax=Symbiochloris irregularis TaxID=706552 RepID=A0AAW1P524_9CHLO